jgi:hypothetical protein
VAIVSLIVLLVALGIAALINSHPWTASPVAPQLSVAPGLEVALGDAVAVSRGPQLAVAPAAPAAGGKARFVAHRVGEGGGGGDGAPQLGIAPARVAKTPQPVAAPEGAPKPHPPEPLPAPESAPAPEAVPVAAPAPPPATESTPAPSGPIAGVEGSPKGPIAGGVGVEGALTDVQVCDGDEYTLSFSRGETGAIGEPVPVPSVGTALHKAIVYFGSSSEGDDFYLAFLDGRLIGMGESVRPIDPGRDCALIDSELLDLGEGVEGTYEIRFEGISLGEPPESVLP